MRIRPKIIIHTNIICLSAVLAVSAIGFTVLFNTYKAMLSQKSEINAELIASRIDTWLTEQRSALTQNIDAGTRFVYRWTGKPVLEKNERT